MPSITVSFVAASGQWNDCSRTGRCVIATGLSYKTVVHCPYSSSFQKVSQILSLATLLLSENFSVAIRVYFINRPINFIDAKQQPAAINRTIENGIYFGGVTIIFQQMIRIATNQSEPETETFAENTSPPFFNGGPQNKLYIHKRWLSANSNTKNYLN